MKLLKSTCIKNYEKQKNKELYVFGIVYLIHKILHRNYWELQKLRKLDKHNATSTKLKPKEFFLS